MIVIDGVKRVKRDSWRQTIKADQSMPCKLSGRTGEAAVFHDVRQATKRFICIISLDRSWLEVSWNECTALADGVPDTSADAVV